ncbi:MAG: hypothetical protein NT096_12060 [Proteobacteria bacterium]|nr:hypothetical protein [Pseudomonadota bacterium]
MKNVRLLLKYFAPYRWSAVRSILYNILSAVFALGTYTLAMPFLKILFKTVEPTAYPGNFQLSTDYLDSFSKYYLSSFIEKNGQAGALLLVVIIVIGASLFILSGICEESCITKFSDFRYLSFPMQGKAML